VKVGLVLTTFWYVMTLTTKLIVDQYFTCFRLKLCFRLHVCILHLISTEVYRWAPRGTGEDKYMQGVLTVLCHVVLTGHVTLGYQVYVLPIVIFYMLLNVSSIINWITSYFFWHSQRAGTPLVPDWRPSQMRCIDAKRGSKIGRIFTAKHQRSPRPA
jgi:hypothetical protein